MSVTQPIFKKVPLSQDKYHLNVVKKVAILIHHTASSGNPLNVVNAWQGRTDGVNVPYVIAGVEDGKGQYKDGDIIECYDDKYWGYHLGVKTANNVLLNSQSVPVEICNWGQLTKTPDGKFHNYVNGEVPADQVITLDKPHRGFTYYHKYTDNQIASLKSLIIYLCDKYKISTHYNEKMFDLCPDALAGAGGIFGHISYRIDKVDVSPQPNLISMLKSISI